MDGRDIKFPFKINVTTGEANTLGTSHVLSDILLFSLQDLISSSQQPSEEVTTVSYIVQMRKLRAREDNNTELVNGPAKIAILAPC